MSEMDPHIQAILDKSYGEHAPEYVMERRHELIKRLLFERDMLEHIPGKSHALEDIEQDLKNALGLKDESP